MSFLIVTIFYYTSREGGIVLEIVAKHRGALWGLNLSFIKFLKDNCGALGTAGVIKNCLRWEGGLRLFGFTLKNPTNFLTMRVRGQKSLILLYAIFEWSLVRENKKLKIDI